MATISIDENADKCAIYLDKDVHIRWVSIGTALGVSTDSLMASFLLRQFEAVQAGVLSETLCLQCQRPLTLFCGWCNFQTTKTVTQSAERLTSTGHDKVTAEDGRDVHVIGKEYRQELHEEIDRVMPADIKQDRQECLEEMDTVMPDDSNEDRQEHLEEMDTVMPDDVKEYRQKCLREIDTVMPENVKEYRQECLQEIDKAMPADLNEDRQERLSKMDTVPSADIKKDRQERLEEIDTVMPTDAPRQQKAKEPLKVGPSSQNLSAVKSHALSLINVRLGSVNACILRTQTWNSGITAFVCAECNSSFETRNSLLEHGQTVHGLSDPQKKSQVLFCCSSCDQIFTTKRSLDKHEQTHHTPDGPQTLEGCTVTFSTDVSAKLRTHTRTKKHIWTCTRCDAVFTSVVPYRKHMKSHGITSPFACDSCEMSFKTRAKLKAHNCVSKQNAQQSSLGTDESNSTDKPSEAKSPAEVMSPSETEWPSETKSRNRSRRKPRSGGRKTKKFMCEDCGKVFLTNEGFKKHTIFVHNAVDDRPLTCEYCQQRFTFKFELQRHVLRHKGERSFACDMCSATFLDRFALNRHKKIHSADRRMFICELCGASFTENINLKAHMRVHTGERPYKCSFCDASFRLRSILRKHERMHKGIKKHICTECGRGFTEREYWRAHMRTHTGERPFVCDICGSGFAQKGTLSSHRKTHTAAGAKPAGVDFPI